MVWLLGRCLGSFGIEYGDGDGDEGVVVVVVVVRRREKLRDGEFEFGNTCGNLLDYLGYDVCTLFGYGHLGDWIENSIVFGMSVPRI